jgi:hypothetical protein
LGLIDDWKKLPDWPKYATALFSDVDQNFDEANEGDASTTEHVFIAERNYDRLPIGLSHVSATGLPRGIAQFSACIPQKSQRAPGRGADLLLLTCGIGFCLGFYKLVLVEIKNSALVKAAIKVGYRIDNQFRPPNRGILGHSDSCVLSLTREVWTRLWQAEFEVKAQYVPYVRDVIAAAGRSVEMRDSDPELESKDEAMSWHKTRRVREELVRPPRKALA